MPGLLQGPEAVTPQALEAQGYRAAWLNLPPSENDPNWLKGYRDGEADAAKAARFRPLNSAASRSATGRARARAQGENDFLFGAKA
jgi:hypothetical protein